MRIRWTIAIALLGLSCFIASFLCARAAFKPNAGGQEPLAGRNGRVQPPPAPSQHFRTLHASFFSASYPDNWKISGQDTDTVTVVAPGGTVTGKDGSLPAIAYGMVASIYQPLTENGRKMTLADATNQLVSELVHSNPRIRVISEASVNRRIGGQEAFSVTTLEPSPVGNQAEMNWMVTSYRSEGLWYVIFIAPKPDWNRYQPVFDQILSSVRFPR